MSSQPEEKKAKKVTFELRADAGRKVSVAASFNNWDPAANRLRWNAKDGMYRTHIRLVPGRHEYKFVVDGIWCVDPECDEWVPNDYGSLNSVVIVD